VIYERCFPLFYRKISIGIKKEPNTNVAFENPQYAQGPKVHVCGCLTAEIVL